MKGKRTINIPGEVASVAADGIAVSADGVYDYVLKKFQEDINYDVYRRLEALEKSLKQG